MAKSKKLAVLSPVDGLIADIVARVTEITYPPVKKEGFTERDHKIVKAATEIGGCATAKLLDLLEIVVEHKLPRPGDGAIFPPGTAVWMTSKKNGHDYPMNEVVLVYEGEIGISSKGRTGNHLPIESHDAFNNDGRLATKEEIAAGIGKIVNSLLDPNAPKGFLMFKPEVAGHAAEFLKGIGVWK